jgi:hypothetical protein
VRVRIRRFVKVMSREDGASRLMSDSAIADAAIRL